MLYGCGDNRDGDGDGDGDGDCDGDDDGESVVGVDDSKKGRKLG